MGEITELLNYLNSTGGGIPLTVTQTTTQNSYQFWLTIIVAGFFILYFLYMFLGQLVLRISALVRLVLFKKKIGKHIMVIKHTNSDLFSQSMIDRRTLEDIQKAFLKFNGKDFDLILYTPGGEVFSAVYISRVLNKYPGKIRCFVPTFAMSGGTLLALSTDEIYMNDYACLGSVDPQLGNLFKFGSAKAWKHIVKYKGKKAEDSSISFAMIGEQYTKSIKDIISNLLTDKLSKKDNKRLTDFLVSGNIEHGFNLTKDILKGFGMPIKDINAETNKQILKIIKYMPDGVFAV